MLVVAPLAALVALLVGIAVTELAIRRATFGAALLLFAFAVGVAISPTPSVSLGGARISVTDVASAIVLGAAFARLLRQRLRDSQLILLVLLGLLGISLIRGAQTYGVEGALNDFRTFMRYFGAVLYFSTFRATPALRDRLGQLWTWAAAGLTALLALRWLNRLFGIPIGILDATYDAPIRVLAGPESFFYAEALLIALPATAVLSPASRRTRMLLAAFLLLINVALNRRTAFAALLAALGALVVHNRGFRRSMGPAAGLVLAAIAVFALLSPAEQIPQGEIAQSATDTGTLEWRIEGWEQLIAEHVEAGLLDVLFGQPMGAGYERTANDVEVVSNPHSWYVQVLLRGGVIGLLAMISLYAYAVLGLHRAARFRAELRPSGFDAPTLWALLLGELVWLLTWEPHLLQGMVLGLAIAAVPALRQPQQRQPGRATTPGGAERTGGGTRWAPETGIEDVG